MSLKKMLRLFTPLLFAMALQGQAAPNPRLSALQIEIWPEYDQPRALVILKAELAPDAALPADVTLRIPEAAGQPSAVAYTDASGKLLNLAYEHAPDGKFVKLRLRPPQRSLHVEFYDAIDAAKVQREYRYTWPGDMAVEKVAVLVKEPAAASNLSVQPKLDIPGKSPDGLAHHGAVLGALKAGEALPITIRYIKSDSRTSTEILAAAAPAAAPASASPVAASGTAAAAAPGFAMPSWPLLFIGAGVLGLLVTGGAFLWSRRETASPTGRHCRKCGKATRAGDRFCAHCGAAQS